MRHLPKLLGLFAAALPIFGTGQVTHVFSSTDSDGNIRWATQAFDSSYVHHFSVTAPPEKPIHPPTASAAGSLRNQWQPLIQVAANRHGVSSHLISAIVQVESRFNPNAVSPKGAIGLMQLMPSTAIKYGVRDARQLFDPRVNLDVGVRHVKDLLKEHGGNIVLALASYNAGSGAVAKHGLRIPRFNETMLYVPAVLVAAPSTSVHND